MAAKTKVLIFAFILTYGATNSFEVKKIEGVNGNVENVLFDSKFNKFVFCSVYGNEDLEILYKLDPENNVIFVKELVDVDCVMYLNDKDELYLICGQSPGLTGNISVIRANSTEVEKILSFDNFLSIFQDNTGNLMYNGFNPGLLFLKYNTTIPVTVKNLENFLRIYDPFATDENGDTYVAGYEFDPETGDVVENQFVVIPGDTKEEAPEGFVIQGVLDDPMKDLIESVSITSNNEIIIGIINEELMPSVKKLVNGTVITIYGNEGYDKYSIFAGKRTIIVAYDYEHGMSRITSLGDDGEKVEILNSRNDTWTIEYKDVSIDEEGNAFISWLSAEEQISQLAFLDYKNTMAVDVDSEDINTIFGIVFDGNNNLWINTDSQTYFIENGGLEGQKVPDSKHFAGMWINRVKKSNEVYLSTGNEFYVISN